MRLTRDMAESGWKIAAVSALLMLGTYLSLGQAPEGAPAPPEGAPRTRMERGANPERQLVMLTRMLNLTADQQKGVRTVLEQQATEMKALQEKAPADPSTGQTPESREARMTQMRQIREESNTKIAALLDEGQKKTFADWTQKRKQEMERRQHGEPGGPPPPAPDGAAPPPPNE
jgi:Spy/CpxP family protein refolding chaperone